MGDSVQDCMANVQAQITTTTVGLCDLEPLLCDLLDGTIMGKERVQAWVRIRSSVHDTSSRLQTVDGHCPSSAKPSADNLKGVSGCLS